MASRVHQFLCLSDNFGVLLHDPETQRTASIDAPEAKPILAALGSMDWELSDILITHHHADHTQGIAELKARYPDVKIAGPAKEADKIPALDTKLVENDYVIIGGLKGRIIEVPGHTLGHIAYYFGPDDLLFAGDTLFSLGCGRPVEAPSAVLFNSLMKLARLPGQTEVYCGHEYTLSNARFALSVDGGNDLLIERAAEVEKLRSKGEFALPTTIALEIATNPFLRADEPELKAALGMSDADAVDVFAELRERKNRS